MIGALWGWKAVTAPFPGKAAAPVCENQTVTRGDKVYPSEIIVSVYNAGTRFGLAGRTMQIFTDQGFQQGDVGDAPQAAARSRSSRSGRPTRATRPSGWWRAASGRRTRS